MKLFIISNRLPVKVSEKAEQFLFTRSEGGLATGLDSLHTQYEKHWIGWPGLNVEKPESRQRIREELEKLDFHPVFLSAEQIENYYEGYSNSTIWPLCHYFFSYTQYRQNFWETYREVNRLFCEEVRHLVGSDDIVCPHFASAISTTFRSPATNYSGYCPNGQNYCEECWAQI